MTPLVGVALVALFGIALYAVFGGADFGGGVWDLLASGPRRDRQREAVTLAIGPVWEANHVWLIFAIVLLFTCFPPAFAQLCVGLYFPLTAALIGIVLRGAAFVFRNYAFDATSTALTWGVVFGSASILAPFAFGVGAGALATGTFAWGSPFALVVGAFAVAFCAQVAAVFLCAEVHDPELLDDFRLRAMYATGAIAVIGAIALGVSFMSEPHLFRALTAPRALAGIGVAMGLGLVVFALVAVRRYGLARIAVAGEAVSILGGWFGAQTPYLIPGRITYVDAAAPQAMLVAYLVALGIGAVFLVPSLALLFAVFKAPRRSPVERQ